MSVLPEAVEVDGTTFDRVDAPEGIACWTACLDDRAETIAVSLMIEPAAAPGDAAVRAAALVLTEIDRLVAAGAHFLREQLRSPEHELTREESALLEREVLPFAGAEIVVWADGTWMLRFAESPLRMADPFGIGVTFDGDVPRAVEDLSSAEPVDEQE
ncbi:hypothetical protein [Nocardia sp. MW-W600-9]